MAPSSALVSKIKVQLKLAISRLRMVQQKDSAIAKQQRRAMAQLLESGKEESARIRVENIIQSDIHTELLEILELYSELLLARTGLLELPQCDPGLEEAVKSLIYAAPRTEIKELHQVRVLLVEKYGKEFALDAGTGGKVGERVLRKLRVEPPSGELVELYLKEIARTYAIKWPKGQAEPPAYDDDGEGGAAQAETTKEPEPALEANELSRATPPKDIGPRSPVSVVPPKSSTDNVSPQIKLPAPPELKPGGKMALTKKGDTGGDGDRGGGGAPKGGVVGGKIPEVDELAKRFAALKK